MSADRAARLWALALACALALHAWSLVADGGRDGLWHLLWSCHLATLLMAIALLAGTRWLVAAALLFHLAIGFPAWLVQVIVTRGTFGGATLVPHLLATSVVVHLLPIVTGIACLGRARLPKIALAAALAMQIVPVLLSRFATPPDLNVNLAHAPWPPVAAALPTVFRFQLAESAAAVVALAIVFAMWNAWVAYSK